MFIMCDEMWNSVDIYGPQADIDRFKRRFVIPAIEGDHAGSTLTLDLDNVSADPTWNFRELVQHERGMYSFAFDSNTNFPTHAFERFVEIFPRLYFDCECIAHDDSRMGYGWFNTPPGGQPFRYDYDVPQDYWTGRSCKRSGPEERRHMIVINELKQRLRGTDCARPGS